MESIYSIFNLLTISDAGGLVAAVLLAGFMRGFVGFGSAMVLVMILSLLFGPRAAVPIISLAGIVTAVQLLPDVIRLADRRFVIPFGFAAFIGAPTGTLVLISINPELMKIGMSIFILFMVLLVWRGWQINGEYISIISTGLLAGLVQGSAGIGGPLAVALALARGGNLTRQRANVIGAILSLTACGIPAMCYYNLYTLEVIIVSTVIVPLYVLATWLGARIFSQHGQYIFRITALWVLAIMGIVTLVIAIQDYTI